MSEMDMLQPEESSEASETEKEQSKETEGTRTEEAQEATERERAEAQALEDATYNPGSYIEGSKTFEEAEEIQTAFTELMASSQEAKDGEPGSKPEAEGKEQAGA